MTAPTALPTATAAELEALYRFRQRTNWRPQNTASNSANGSTAGKVAWYHGGPDGQLHAVAVWAPGPETGRIEALCNATSWGWSEAGPGTVRGRCSECATKAHGMPLLNPHR